MRKISDYALIGDCHSAALVSRDGSIDWCCFPKFDSPSVFTRLLDKDKGGSFLITPEVSFRVTRRYKPGTCMLVTEFITAEGRFTVTDMMNVYKDENANSAGVGTRHAILRKITGLEGRVPVRVAITPRFEYGAYIPRFRLTSDTTGEIVGGADALWVTSTRKLSAGNDRIRALWRVEKGEEVYLQVAWSNSREEYTSNEHPTPDELNLYYRQTEDFWQKWIEPLNYSGFFEKEVERSAFTLKLLTYAPTGAIVAAPTTSLPEEIGGIRNWDYRFTWIRDTSLTLISLMILNFKDEAASFRQWLRRTSAGRPSDLRIMYSITGRRFLPEITLDHLAGHRNSRPVRIGNGAAGQRQLDVYGQMIDAVYLYVRLGGKVTPTNWVYLQGLADEVIRYWELPDSGIWEIRDTPRHFIHSKLMCWAALDRIVKIARARRLTGPVGKWAAIRDRIYNYLLSEGCSDGWFPQYAGGTEADASTLLVPAMGLLPPRDERVIRTLEEVEKQLTYDSLVDRYRLQDGLSGGEGAFLLCSLWLADAWIHAGRIERGRDILERVVSLANDTGLLAEEADHATGEALGNFPQAFTHMALVTTAVHLTAAESGELPSGNSPYSFAEFALEHVHRSSENNS